MEIKYFSLGTIENTRLIRIFRLIFGIVCITVAIFWITLIIRSLKPNITTWISILFLAGFGFYQIWSGIGHADRFIEIASDCIRLKKNSILPVVDMPADKIEKIEFYPLNIVFFLKSKRRVLLRFGTTYNDIIENVTEEVISFAEFNKIPSKVIEERL